jgi:beta-phosphoglucomutase-like phosphatase (HAD superfamily)
LQGLQEPDCFSSLGICAGEVIIIEDSPIGLSAAIDAGSASFCVTRRPEQQQIHTGVIDAGKEY